MKRNVLLLIPLLLMFTSCNDKVETIKVSRVSKLINEASKGFKMLAISSQKVYRSENNEEMFTNLTNYDYSFENLDEVKTTQIIKYKYGGEDKEASLNVVRSKDGYVSQEYVNYKNEIDTSPLLSEGNYVTYDQYFLNPFLLLNEDDFNKVDENTYSLNKNKIDKFDYYLTGKNVPSKEILFIFNEDSLSEIHSTSITINSKAKDSEKGVYVKAYYYYEDVITLSDFGTTKINNIKLSEKKNNADLERIFNKLDGYNFTLELSLALAGSEYTDKYTEVSYFDGSHYLKYSSKVNEDLSSSKLYQFDESLNDNLFYEYEYNSDAQEFIKTTKSESNSYNVFPQEREFFVPKLSDISINLFSEEKDENGYYEVTNPYAVSFIGNAFTSKAETNSSFTFGKGIYAAIKEDGDNIVIETKFQEISQFGDVYEFNYRMTYKDIGTTIVPGIN